jgi:hypothetical protein
MTASAFRQIALGLEGATESAHMGHPDFRVNGRIFATLQTAERGMVKLTPEEQSHFVRTHRGAFVPENGAWGLQGCTRVLLEAADQEAVGEAMTLAWRHALAKPPTRGKARKRR